jgi:DNA polymerase-3 subunit epsilon
MKNMKQEPFDARDFAAIDFETANMKRSSVCSVGLVVVRGGEIVEKRYHLIQPRPNWYTGWATRVHGLTAADTDDAPSFPEVWATLAPLVEGFPLVAHNASFDAGCLRAAHACHDMACPEYRFFCTYRASARRFPGLRDHKLSTVAGHVGYDLKNHHHALADAEACARIALRVFPLEEGC